MGSFQVQVLIEPLKRHALFSLWNLRTGAGLYIMCTAGLYRVQLAVIMYVHYREKKIPCGNIHSAYRTAHTKEA